jgi:hypothetical protein
LDRHNIGVKLLFVICALAAMVGPALAAAKVPLPRPRPADLGGATPAAASSEPAPEDAEKPEQAPTTEAEKKPEGPAPSACFVRLQQSAAIKAVPSISKAGGCIAEDVVQLDGVILADKRQVAMEPPATLRCGMAQAVTDWVREELVSAAVQLGAPLRAVENLASYDCRGRNNILGALLSEHGKANALDVHALKLMNGTTALLTDPYVAKDIRDSLRKTACARFMTVLGPGSDGYHEDHVHVDLAERKGDYRLCQWEVRLPTFRAASSPHIASYGKPTPHFVPASLPVAPPADTAKETKTKPAPRRKL